MERHQIELDAPAFDRPGTVIRYGHWGRPVIVFPSESGRAWDYENNGMVGAVSHLLDEGRVKLYCVDSFDHASWSDRSVPIEERARRHQAYQEWVTDQVAAYVGADSPRASEAIVTGCSLGAYHALQLALQRADLFPVAICQSGNYDPSTWHSWGERGDAAYFTNPVDYVPHLARRPPGVAAIAAARRAHGGRGRVGDPPDRLVAQRPAPGPVAGGEGDLARSRRLGSRRVP